ncbi:DNA primase [Alphaproteobacteria bacterium endosymbiont of Tiliacea citrago]|uniref:DNA primase n=1 Tax=Alphaproteobacteria bacterium endosymbiont of Tiliacea citrago TaxID=3077944 RepID=UPI00313AEBB0
MQNKFSLIKDKIKLLDYISKFVKLKSVGDGKFVGLCPFHHEKTASFHVNSDNNLFHCFGCGRGGDLISFYSEYNHCDTKKAFNDLCEIVGVEIKQKNVSNSLNKLLDFFSINNEAIDFLKDRGVNLEFVEKFHLGWCPSFQLVQEFLNRYKLNFSKFGFKSVFFKVFQNRVTFPIFDDYGNLVSFGGRCLDSRDSKYINGADSFVFHKKEILYGLNFIKKKDVIYLVEGYLDAILMQQNGFSAVACMGTAVSKEHIEKLWKHTDKIIICLDGDQAGRKASHKVALLALKLIRTGKEIDFILLDSNQDPASYLLNNKDLSDLKTYPLFEFFLILEKIPENPDKKALFFKNLFDLLGSMCDPFLKIEYKKSWNQFRWSKKKFQNVEKLKNYETKTLFLLLFKLILGYNELLDQVAEDFLKLNMDNSLKKELLLLLNGSSLSCSFLDEVAKINFGLDGLSFDTALEEWYKIFNHIQNVSNKERETRFLKNFTEEEWDLYKQWLSQRDYNE